MFNNRIDILEDGDFSKLRGMQLFEQPDGTQLVGLLLELDPASKHFGPDDPRPLLLHLTDGVSHRIMPIEPLPGVSLGIVQPISAAAAAAPVPEAAAPAPEPAAPTPEPAAPANPFAGAGAETISVQPVSTEMQSGLDERGKE